jgi:ATPase subunit of ABC transporter with duplicated ATPase domains
MALEKYEGTIIVVSHDRQFVDAVANRIFVVKTGGQIIDWHGNYEDYLDSEGLS